MMGLCADTTLGEIRAHVVDLTRLGDLDGLMRLSMALHDIVRGFRPLDVRTEPKRVALHLLGDDQGFIASLEEEVP